MSASALLLAAAVPLAASAGGDAPCRVPMVAWSQTGVEVRMVEIATGGGRAFPTGPGSPWITGVFPLSPGLSADLVRGDDAVMLFVSCAADEVRPSVLSADGTSRDLPAVPRSNFAELTVRVNVVTGDGLRLAFRVENGAARRDTGAPVVNLLDGRVPMTAGDVAVTLEIGTPPADAVLSGVAELTYRDGFVLVPVSIGGEPPQDFILDLAATGSVIGADFVPPGVGLTPIVAKEHSAAGTRDIRQGPEGAGGEVTATLGVARVGPLSIGDAALREAELHVVQHLPEIGRPIAGVLGLNVLRRAGRLAFGYPARASGRRNHVDDATAHGTNHGEAGPEEAAGIDGASHAEALLLGEAVGHADPGRTVVRAPLKNVARLLFVPVEIAGQEVDLVFDTGARLTLLPPPLAERLGIEVTTPDAATLRGLDGNPISIDLATIDELRVGGVGFEGEPIGIAHLPVFAAIGLPEHTGVLGAPFWSRFERIVVDFEESTLELLPREEP